LHHIQSPLSWPPFLPPKMSQHQFINRSSNLLPSQLMRRELLPSRFPQPTNLMTLSPSPSSPSERSLDTTPSSPLERRREMREKTSPTTTMLPSPCSSEESQRIPQHHQSSMFTTHTEPNISDKPLIKVSHMMTKTNMCERLSVI